MFLVSKRLWFYRVIDKGPELLRNLCSLHICVCCSFVLLLACHDNLLKREEQEREEFLGTTPMSCTFLEITMSQLAYIKINERSYIWTKSPGHKCHWEDLSQSANFKWIQFSVFDIYHQSFNNFP